MSYEALKSAIINATSQLRQHIHLQTPISSLHPFLETLRITYDNSSLADHIQATIDLYNELLWLKNELNRLPVKNSYIRGFSTIVMTKFDLDTHAPPSISKLFRILIEGITYFSSEEPPQGNEVIYHRLVSCGSIENADEFRDNNLVCINKLSPEERQRRKVLTETCYMERKIYEELYINEKFFFSKKGEPPSMDNSHISRLNSVEKDYQTCFPKCEIKVEINYTEDVPNNVTIIKLKNNIEISREIYVKTFKKYRFEMKYDPIVFCILTKGDQIYQKYQSFYGKSKWIKSSYENMKNHSDPIMKSTFGLHSKSIKSVP